jgi:hypothetical protein
VCIVVVIVIVVISPAGQFGRRRIHRDDAARQQKSL